MFLKMQIVEVKLILKLQHTANLQKHYMVTKPFKHCKLLKRGI